MPDYSLGRIPSPPDQRDLNFPMSLVLGTVVALPKRRMWRAGTFKLNQGNLGACVGFTGANWLQNTPVRTRVTNQTGFDLYQACKKVDGIPNTERTYSRALLGVLQKQGVVRRYLWADSLANIRDWVLGVGPVMVGTAWFNDMFDPDRSGQVHASGSFVGGHEYLVRGFDVKTQLFRCVNSWGPNWGLNGEFTVSAADLTSLVFGNGGDAIGVDQV